MWILPVIAIGILIFAAAGSPREAPRALLPPGPPPGPIAVLGEYVRVGHVPPPPVILCAIAEAELLGRNDLANDIMRVFIIPVVYQAELTRARPANPPPVYVPTFDPGPRGGGVRQSPAQSTLTQTNEQIQAMLDRDPKRFIEHAYGAPQAHQVIDLDAVDDMPVEVIAVLPGSEPRLLSSPIIGVDAVDWSRFCDRLSRETPEYVSSRHVGQYRQRKERLVELGIEPVRLLGSAVAQRSALDADLADAHRHATASGLAEQHVRRLITVPGHDGPVQITLSGVLGVIQAAGIDGAVGWLEDPKDRRRYPHTTQAFLHTNGMF